LCRHYTGRRALVKIYSDKKTSWHLSVYFDNKVHQSIYDDIIQNEFNIVPAQYQRKPNCFESCINSKVVHWFFSHYFGIQTGKKYDKISIPQNILNDENILVATIQGLFDSDGTITKNGDIKYATVSKLASEQVAYALNSLGVITNANVWIKDKKYLPLYMVSVASKSKKLYAKRIGFRHPLKKVLLEKFTNSPSSSGHRKAAAKCES